MTMQTTMVITLLIIAVASLMLNVYQWQERRIERKETNKLVADAAMLEHKCDELTKAYNNEVQHVGWAKGRIKDQQAVIDRLKAIGNVSEKTKYVHKQRKEESHD